MLQRDVVAVIYEHAPSVERSHVAREGAVLDNQRAIVTRDAATVRP